MTKRTGKLVKDFEEAARTAGYWEDKEFGASEHDAAQIQLNAAKKILMEDLDREAAKLESLVTDYTRALIRNLEVAAREDGRFETPKTKERLEDSRLALMRNLRYIIDGEGKPMDINLLELLLAIGAAEPKSEEED
jgi:hypothetical protein